MPHYFIPSHREGVISWGPDQRKIEDHLFDARTAYEITQAEKLGYVQADPGSIQHQNLLAELYNRPELGLDDEPAEVSVTDEAVLAQKHVLAQMGLSSAQIEAAIAPLLAAAKSAEGPAPKTRRRAAK